MGMLVIHLNRGILTLIHALFIYLLGCPFYIDANFLVLSLKRKLLTVICELLTLKSE